jgi:hypothetical protein
MEYLQTVAAYKAAFTRYVAGTRAEAEYIELATTTCALTFQLRAAGWPVEAIIVLLKTEVPRVAASNACMLKDSLSLVVTDAIECFYQAP